jgi:ribose/xylose/arabinose/galactoside ABC-type transport system permease subunit
MDLIARRTLFGRRIYAVGGDAQAAARVGINVSRITVYVFVLSGTFAALGGILVASRLQSVTQGIGSGGVLLDAIAAVVIGGTSLFGGRGGILGTILGALIVYAFNIGLALANVDDQLRILTIGVLIIVAVSIDQWIRKVRS